MKAGEAIILDLLDATTDNEKIKQNFKNYLDNTNEKFHRFMPEEDYHPVAEDERNF